MSVVYDKIDMSKRKSKSSFYNIPSFSRLSITSHSRFNLSEFESDIHIFVKEYRNRVKRQQIAEEENNPSPFVSFAATQGIDVIDFEWHLDNEERFYKNTPNKDILNLSYLSELGFISCMVYSLDGEYIVVGHSTGLIQMRQGTTGVVLCTLRNIQFPPKPVYALAFSKKEERVCYASCLDGVIYRIEIPNIALPESQAKCCIRADPALECLNTQFYGSPGIATYAAPFITQRSGALSIGITADQSKMAAGYTDTSIKVYDMETQEAVLTFKVHKLRLQFIPKKLQRMHFGQVCAVKCHDQNPCMFASAAWDKTLRIWDTRCPVGCVMTFEGVNICSNSIDLNRERGDVLDRHKGKISPPGIVMRLGNRGSDGVLSEVVYMRQHCIAGSWQPTDALTVWDLTARKRLNVVRVQNRRPDVDGEYIYACQYWKSQLYNRKGKYGIIGGSGTNCLEIINLHNRYISCSYPAPGTILAITSHEEKIAFGGTAPIFNIVMFHDPKHQKYEVPPDDDDFGNAVMTFYDEDNDDHDIMNKESDLFIEAEKPSLLSNRPSVRMSIPK